MKVFDAFNRVMSGRRKQRDDRPFPPDLLRDEHAYLSNFAGSRSVMYSSPIAEKCFDPIQNPQNENFLNRHIYNHHYPTTRHAGNPYIVHSGQNLHPLDDQTFIPLYSDQLLQKNSSSMAFTLPSLSQSNSEYGSSKSNLSRRRHGSFSNSASPKPLFPVKNELSYTTTGNGFHQRSRSSSGGGYRQVKIPNQGLKTQPYTMYNSNKPTTIRDVEYSNNNNEYQSRFGYNGSIGPNASNKEQPESDCNGNDNKKIPNEPIYSEPLPPISSQVKEAEHRTNIKYFPDPNDPVQISNHIYEYLVKKSNKSSENGRHGNYQPPLPPLPREKR